MQGHVCFTKFKTARSFGDAIRTDIITIDMTNDEQYQLAKRSGEFISYAKPQKLNKEKRKLLK